MLTGSVAISSCWTWGGQLFVRRLRWAAVGASPRILNMGNRHIHII